MHARADQPAQCQPAPHFVRAHDESPAGCSNSAHPPPIWTCHPPSGGQSTFHLPHWGHVSGRRTACTMSASTPFRTGPCRVTRGVLKLRSSSIHFAMPPPLGWPVNRPSSTWWTSPDVSGRRAAPCSLPSSCVAGALNRGTTRRGKLLTPSSKLPGGRTDTARQ